VPFCFQENIMQRFKTSPAGRAFIESNEGLTLVAKPDAKGKSEIGYGHDIKPGEDFSRGITKDQADAILSADLTEFEPYVNAAVPDSCTQNQFDALMDFIYEEGQGGFHVLMSHGWAQIPVQILRWDIVEGQPNDAVETRRKKELVLFNS
jgi:GH24 family phage-related lysozyme (muramidase)